jgi:pyruvate/2-oxoglutarate dehydrogenase complex dihydrolipoamide dehydrogenase (E3) component
VDTVDAIVLGMGPGGEEVAGRLAGAGLTVVGIDAGLLGGECPYWGCIPSKMMVRASGLLAEAGRVHGMAGEATVRRSWDPVAARVADGTDHWDDAVAVERFEAKGGRFLRGWGTIEGPRQVRVGDTVLRARRALVVATGSSPTVPPVDGLSAVPYWTNREAVECETVPPSLVVLGGGSVGVELGQVFARFGAAVTILEAGGRLLAKEEPESSQTVRDALEADGVTVRTGVAPSRVVGTGGAGVTVDLEDGTSVEGDRLLVAVGRAPDLEAIGVGSLGVDAAGGGIPVDGRLRVSDGVWAVGDVTGVGNFTHLAVYQARIAADDILGRQPSAAAYHALPRVTFTDPEIGAVGQTEFEARRAGLAVSVATTPLPSSARGWIHGPGNAGFVKLVVDAARGVLVGATSAGPSGGEMLGLLSLAVHVAAPVADLRRMIYAYPTFHRAIEAALDELPR